MTTNEQRLKKLRDLLDRIEQLPPSSERERMLREVRARVVDVDTGVTPRAMLPTDVEPIPLPPPAAPSAPPAPPAPRTPKKVAPPRVVVAPRPPRAVSPPPPPAPVDASPLAAGELLSLDDVPPPEPRPRRTAVPWARGLRG